MDKNKNSQEISIRSSAGKYIVFAISTGGSQTSVEMRYEDENVWLTQKMMAMFYDISAPTINEHIKRFF
jgi:hypothetical protein